jgi:hypothetical protein
MKHFTVKSHIICSDKATSSPVSRALTQLMKIGIRMSETAKKHASLDD